MRSLACVILALAARAHADTATPISFADAMRSAANAPALNAQRYDIVAADALVGAAGAWAGPSLRIESNRLTAHLVAGASLPLPVFGTLGASRRVAAANADVVRSEAVVDTRDVLHQIAAAWIALARADGEHAAAVVAAEQADQLEKVARERLASGAGAEVDLGATSAAHARATLAESSARRRQEAASATLAGLLGRDPLVRLAAEGDIPSGAPVSIAALQARLRSHPKRTVIAGRIAAASAGAAEARTARLPSLALEGQVSMFDPTQPGTDVLVGLSIDVPLFAHAADRVHAANATVEAERARLAATEVELGGQLVAAYRRWQEASETLAALEKTILPAQEKASSLAMQAFREGARDVSSALQADRDLAAVRAELVAARADTGLAWIDLRAASGDPLGAANAP